MSSDDLRPWQTSEFWEERFTEGETPWDLEGPSESLSDVEKSAELIPGSRVMVPGCGRGHDALYFARLGYEVSAVDWSQAAISDLRVLARREGLPIEALASDLFEVPETWYGTFDVWAEHTFFCAVDPSDRERYVEQVLNLLRAGGRLIGSFFISEESQNGSIRSEDGKTVAGPPFWSSKEDFERLFAEDFDILKLQKSEFVHPKVGQAEWLVDMKRKQ